MLRFPRPRLPRRKFRKTLNDRRRDLIFIGSAQDFPHFQSRHRACADSDFRARQENAPNESSRPATPPRAPCSAILNDKKIRLIILDQRFDPLDRLEILSAVDIL